ncbi:Cycloheximide resistance protein [Wickerhamomyces ciferrii]|uniref:Cycloheximide resistance protein n=1 Tax=Wickerhamomyces ciferrii (strain ATCC 14091 / BCRC 22168 / CBS 111 / JCM 3599 / NBRC 0793 / NRRL Y-1031 F-60-10) TaxID=1206466 RepID=K0KHP5_WICCF|nr:Cycloheximide resistance protein [Wickerhamomyces ciferrii]CCH40683.1 Cycloheximide resistance protein [Wickerhamomyces ciferrii]
MSYNKFEVFLRNTVFGKLVHYTSRGKFFKTNEEYEDYEIPSKYLNAQEPVLVDWDGEDDLQNPRNWPLPLKLFFAFLASFICFSVYIASAIYTPGIEMVKKDLNVNTTVATLPLALFVVGYGTGPLLFGPLTENPKIGRMPVYFGTTFIFMILQIPTALVKNITGFCILRFLAGFFAAAPIGIGPAAICDVLTIPYGPIGIGFWSISAVGGPAFGPIIGSVLTVKESWRWGFWFLLILNGFTLLCMTFFFPESYEKALFYKKAMILKTKTGNENITSRGEIELSEMNRIEVIKDTLWRPIEMTMKEPVVLLIHMYISLMYAIMYLWFEAFPIVFQQTKHFTLVTMGLAYLSSFIGNMIGAMIYLPWTYKIHTRKAIVNQEVQPEIFLPMTIVGSIFMPVGIFIFAWTSSPDINWFPPMIGVAIFNIGGFMVFQCLFNYLGLSFPRYMASAFSGNACMRSIISGVLALFGHFMFNNLGSKRFPVGWGSTILGFCTAGMIAIPVLFYLNGPKLRARSKYAGFDMDDKVEEVHEPFDEESKKVDDLESV